MIRPAQKSDVPGIRDLYRSTGRPRRAVVRSAEYFVAFEDQRLVGCAAVRPVGDGGYLYGLAVHSDYRRRRIGSALTVARLRRVRQRGGKVAIVLAMFWNVRFFKRLGFELIRRDGLPRIYRRITDLRDPLYRRSAVLSHGLKRRRLTQA
jgi:N-acetylglutamate synthase-like GNAT family acetyltransferase